MMMALTADDDMMVLMWTRMIWMLVMIMMRNFKSLFVFKPLAEIHAYVKRAIHIERYNLNLVFKGIQEKMDGKLRMGSICTGMGTAEIVVETFASVWNPYPAYHFPVEAGCFVCFVCLRFLG